MNENLHKAKQSKNDEFYTQLSTIENELQHYVEFFEGKVVYCNCDDPAFSNFWKFFLSNFNRFRLKGLVSTYYSVSGSYKTEAYRDENKIVISSEALSGDGDFRGAECVEILQSCDIICTNPPFSLYREFIRLLYAYKKDFLIIANFLAVTDLFSFDCIKEGSMRFGLTSRVMHFTTTTVELKSVNAKWFTSLQHKRIPEPLILTKKYSAELYPFYDNYRAIHVPKVKDIPCDYYEPMGVPITYLEKYNPEQFELIEIRRGKRNPLYKGGSKSDALVNGRLIFTKVFVKRR